MGVTSLATGKWIGTYFSEELKAVKPYLYTFKYLEGYEFSKVDLFTDYFVFISLDISLQNSVLPAESNLLFLSIKVLILDCSSAICCLNN